MRPIRQLGMVLAVAGMALSVTACSDDSSDTSGDGEGPVTVKITEMDGQIEPVGKVVDVRRGEDITLQVSSDAADEIHVHSEPEHEFEVKAADDQQFTFSIDTPRTYEVESHELGVVILKLQVR